MNSWEKKKLFDLISEMEKNTNENLSNILFGYSKMLRYLPSDCIRIFVEPQLN